MCILYNLYCIAHIDYTDCQLYFDIILHYNYIDRIIPKTKRFGCVGRGDLTLLFKSCEIYESQGRLI